MSEISRQRTRTYSDINLNESDIIKLEFLCKIKRLQRLCKTIIISENLEDKNIDELKKVYYKLFNEYETIINKEDLNIVMISNKK